jgi:3-oxoacyl-[acyl-carrier protein] reductase
MTEHRLALVTGAARGIGREIALRLARDGNTLVVVDIDHEGARRTAQDLSDVGAEAFSIGLDVGSEDAVLRTYAEIESRFGRLDILVNNAGTFGQRTPVETISLANWEATLRTNLTGTFLMSRGAITMMRRGRWGRIVNIASVSARGRPGIGRSGYVASKAGIIGLSRVLAEELGRDGITVNCVAPSRFRSTMKADKSGGEREVWKPGGVGAMLGRLGDPSDVADGVAWLCSERASFLTGIVLDVNGGTVMR